MNPGVKQRIVLLGPPASGKGTQADRIAKVFGIPHVSTGALLRSECQRGTELGREADSFTSRGGLVPDELAVRIVTAWMTDHGCRFIFDGFPRTVAQAEKLDAALIPLHAPLDLVILLDLDEMQIRRRIMERLSCLSCGATFSTGLHGYEIGSHCPICKNPLVRRNDDTDEALSQRLEVYRIQTLPVVTFYQRSAPDILHRVDAGRGSDAIFNEISLLIGDGKHFCK